MSERDLTVPSMSINEAISALAGIVLGDVSFEMVLERSAGIVKRTIPGAAEVSVTVQNGHPVTAAFTGPLALHVDESQYEAGYGPCLDAIRLGQTITVDDQASESRWPAYSAKAADAGIGSSLSVPMEVAGRHGAAFNVYALQPRAFDAAAISQGEELAGYAAIVLNNAHLYFTATSHAQQMIEAMKSRAVIEQAKGILMGARRCSADEAFTILVKLSQDTHRKLHAVAQTIVDTTLTDE
jgi:GAF domain-containing protein